MCCFSKNVINIDSRFIRPRNSLFVTYILQRFKEITGNKQDE